MEIHVVHVHPCWKAYGYPCRMVYHRLDVPQDVSTECPLGPYETDPHLDSYMDYSLDSHMDFERDSCMDPHAYSHMAVLYEFPYELLHEVLFPRGILVWIPIRIKIS